MKRNLVVSLHLGNSLVLWKVQSNFGTTFGTTFWPRPWSTPDSTDDHMVSTRELQKSMSPLGTFDPAMVGPPSVKKNPAHTATFVNASSFTLQLFKDLLL